MSDQVAPFDGLDGTADNRPRPEAEIAALSSDSGAKLSLSSLPSSLSAVLSRFVTFWGSAFLFIDGFKVRLDQA